MTRAKRPKKGKPTVAAPTTAPLRVTKSADESPGRAIARIGFRPTVHATETALKLNPLLNTNHGKPGPNDLVAELSSVCQLVSGGDMSRPEAMLTAQAHTLDMIFNVMAQRAALNMGQHAQAFSMYFQLALKAQSQCRTTIEALAELKNPHSVAFVRQANIANGPQQVNNSRAENLPNPPNELLEDHSGKRLDYGAAGAASLPHSALEALAPINGADIQRGEGALFHERIQGQHAGISALNGASPKAAAS